MKMNPNDFNALVDLYKSGKTKEVEDGAKSLIKKFPKEIIIHNLLGAVYLEMKKLDLARKSFENISNLLIECGSGMDKVVKTTVLLCDAKNFAKLNDLYTEFFPTNPPARSTPIVGLPLDTLHISIDCIAYIE